MLPLAYFCYNFIGHHLIVSDMADDLIKPSVALFESWPTLVYNIEIFNALLQLDLRPFSFVVIAVFPQNSNIRFDYVKRTLSCLQPFHNLMIPIISLLQFLQLFSHQICLVLRRLFGED
jgi:hypothetical protein